MLSFANAIGNLFNRLGKLGAIISQVDSYQNSQQTNYTTASTGAIAQLNSEPDIQAILGNGYIGTLGGPESACTLATNVAQSILGRMVYRDIPQPNQTLQNSQLIESILEVITQMQQEGASVLTMTIGSSTTSFVGTGNGVLNVSTKRPSDGASLDNSFAETITAVCTVDSYTGNATAGNEKFTFNGQAPENDVFAYDWPLGSGCSVGLSAINGAASSRQGNLLKNSDFETWTSGVPNNWTLVTGAAGTNILQETGLVYSGASALNIVGDGSSTLTAIKQQFDSNTLRPLTQYSICVFVRRDAVVPGAGVATIDLIDGGSTVIDDANGVQNSFTINLTGLSTAYVGYTGVFRTPLILPSAMYIRLRLSTALTNGRSVYFDKMSMGQMTQTYASGPYVALHSGNVPFIKNDYGTIVITNSRGAGGTLDTWQTLWARMFPPMLQAGYLLPASSTPTISDNLI